MLQLFSPIFEHAAVVGDSGVGKSGLSLVLTGQSFVPTEATHAHSDRMRKGRQGELMSQT